MPRRRAHNFGRFRIPKGYRVTMFHKDTPFDDIFDVPTPKEQPEPRREMRRPRKRTR